MLGRKQPAWVFSQLLLPRPLETEQVEAVLLRLAADRAAPPMVFEVRAEHGQELRHLLGVPVDHVRWAQRTLRDLLPGLDLIGINDQIEIRTPVERAVRLRTRPHGLALATGRAELVTLSLLSALDARREPGEQLAVQLLVGPRRSPRHLPPDTPHPGQAWWQLLTIGQQPAPKPVRDQIDDRQGQHGFAMTLRIGVSAITPERRHQLVVGVLGALSAAQSRDVYLDLKFDSAERFNHAVLPWRWPLGLGATEITGLLAWPLGERDLPGLPPLHPRSLRPAAHVASDERVFAVSIAGGVRRQVGIPGRDLTGHLIALGPTGSGKSTALLHLIRADITAGRPVLVVDPKRQLVDDILDRGIPEERIDDVVVIDPADARTGRVVGFNPLDVGGRDPDVVVDGLVAALAGVFKEGWGPRTQDIVNSALLSLARVAHQRAARGASGYTLLDLPRLLTDDAFRRSVVGHVSADPGLGSFWAWYQSLTPQAQAQAVAAPLNKLRQYLLRPSLRAILGQAEPSFRLRDLFVQNKVVLVPLNEGLIGPLTAQLLGSLIAAECWMATLERAAEKNPTARPASVYVDELQQYLNLPTSIGDALAQSRSLGVGWHLAHQFRAQLTPGLRAAVDSNAKSKLVFKPNDPDDARDMAKQAPDLQPLDFLSLRQYEAYANPTAGGAPAGWCLVTTLPPPPPTGFGKRVRQASRDHYAQSIPSALVNESMPGRHIPTETPVGRRRRTT